jgi:hypothetical protein
MNSEPPVFIWAPAQRCGTGLLQRLVTSSKEVIVFGEDRFFTDNLPNLMLEHAEHAEQIKENTGNLASGDHSGWYPSALPKYEDYLDALAGAFQLVVNVYQKSSIELGYARWGTKLPYAESGQVQAINTLLPNARHLYIYRNIFDVMRSIKARKWVESKEGFRLACNNWINSVRQNVDVHGNCEWFHIVSYEKLIGDPKTESQKIQEFLGLKNLDLEVFDHKVNTFVGKQAEGHSESLYVEPVKLTAFEYRICEELHIQAQELIELPESPGLDSCETASTRED